MRVNISMPVVRTDGRSVGGSEAKRARGAPLKGSKEREHKLCKKIGISSSFAFMQPFTRNETGIP